jgi:hypothetical protein
MRKRRMPIYQTNSFACDFCACVVSETKVVYSYEDETTILPEGWKEIDYFPEPWLYDTKLACPKCALKNTKEKNK